MNLGDNKKITLALVEEYSKENPLSTSDKDISDRLNLIYSTAYQELAQTKKITEAKEYENNNKEDGYTKFSLPSDWYQTKRIYKVEKDGSFNNAEYRIIGNEIYLKNNANYILEYYKNSSIIEEDTEDDFELELDQDVQFILPYMVASDMLKTDPSADYQSFEIVYKRKLESLDVRDKIPMATIKEGVL